MPNIKLVLCDIDGTIMPYGQKMVSERMRAAFHAALDAGIRVGVATGRGFSWVPGFFDNDAACIATCVATNGAEIFLDGEKIQEAHLPVEPLREAAEILRGIPGTGMLLFDGAKPLLAVGKREDLAVSMPAYASSCEDVDGVGDEEPSKGNAFVNGGRKEAQELCALLNERVELDDAGSWVKAKNRYPDLMFAFASVGLNYDGFKHFDIADLKAAIDAFSRLEGEEQAKERDVLKAKLVAVRAKVLDDNMRDRQLAAQGRIVFSVTKEDLVDIEHLDELTRQVLGCANKVFGVDVDRHLKTLEDTSLTHERGELLGTLTPHVGFGVSSYGKL